MSETARGAVAEFVAAFAVVLVGAATFVLGRNGQLDLTGIALAYGFAVAVMVSTTAHVSGGFANPAIAIGLWVTGKLSSLRAVSFIAAELLGGVAAASCSGTPSRGRCSTRLRGESRSWIRGSPPARAS